MFGQMFTKLASGVSKFAKPATALVKNNSATILSCLAIGGTGVVALTAFKCTPKYIDCVSKAELTADENGNIKREPVRKRDKAKILFKTMWPMFVAIIVTCGAIVGAHRIQAKHIATLTATCSLMAQRATEAAEQKAEEFIKEKVGPEAAAEYKKEAEAERQEDNKVLDSVATNDILETGGGEDLFVDYMTGITFKASAAYIERCVDMINEMLETQYDEYVTYQDVLSNIIPDCPQSGFAMSEGYSVAAKDIPLMVKFTGSRRLANGRMATLMKFNHSPATLYDE